MRKGRSNNLPRSPSFTALSLCEKETLYGFRDALQGKDRFCGSRHFWFVAGGLRTAQDKDLIYHFGRAQCVGCAFVYQFYQFRRNVAMYYWYAMYFR